MASTQDYITRDVRSTGVLTGSYVAYNILDRDESLEECYIYDQLVLLVDFTIGSLTTAELKVEFSFDGTNWYQETTSDISGGTSADSVLEHQMSGSGAYRIALPIKDRHIRISVKGTGTATGSDVLIKAVLGSTNS